MQWHPDQSENLKETDQLSCWPNSKEMLSGGVEAQNPKAAGWLEK